MDTELTEKIRQLLLERETKLLKELGEVAGKDEDGYKTNFPDYGSEEDENSAEVATFTTNLSVESELEKALRDVRAALKRLDGGTYGKCKYCGEQIDERRLLARPSSSACISCKQTMKSRV
ncbi:hypothetical protein COV04_04145 [Candidatus Uhrbacteria bacterium CG10_big_fil_rev_8_21_14_0_10_48_11]|uniref:Zinc finger DksA/TraR C4-type domain-containing protein n=1 Tax=Candidatus Uhrbacteria bacterium CG10_big_fil_rev_8_21_14_0_10_48_11 TaxID=1975037 RepID=A0A2M8LDQ8_9BACT|nr:MAG: hypothetical protein COV04_04145 [Candidatus Uhrbacteria bacterium CG10_big_fil_rev_8_21_14_0_10_48_11]